MNALWLKNQTLELDSVIVRGLTPIMMLVSGEPYTVLRFSSVWINLDASLNFIEAAKVRWMRGLSARFQARRFFSSGQNSLSLRQNKGGKGKDPFFPL